METTVEEPPPDGAGFGPVGGAGVGPVAGAGVGGAVGHVVDLQHMHAHEQEPQAAGCEHTSEDVHVQSSHVVQGVVASTAQLQGLYNSFRPPWTMASSNDEACTLWCTYTTSKNLSLDDM
jgi:hypothetical protein